MDQKEFFKRTLEDLEQKTQSQDWYDMVLISGLIFKLLYDKRPLVDQFVTDVLVSFEVNNRPLPIGDSLMYWSIEDGFDPETSVPHRKCPINVDRIGLYERQVMIVNSQVITVKDLIRFLRNKQGGVHNDNVSLSEKEQMMKEFQLNFGIGGVPAGLRLMRAIARVVVKGLAPLKGN